jgi:predicted secreted hydrolase
MRQTSVPASPAPPKELPVPYRAPALVLLLIAALMTLVTCQWRPAPEPQSERERFRVAELLGGGEIEGYARALRPRTFSFPEDHGPHPEFRQEWWYYTGNLHAADGRRFGYQLTFFRIALSPHEDTRDSAWASNQAYMAHFALTDVAGRRHHAFERMSRPVIGLAGAQAQPFRVWLEDWSAASSGVLPMRLQAAQDGVAIDLMLDSAKPIVLQGERGLSQRSAAPGDGSYYYSMTRMPTRGTVRVGAEALAVEGLSWMDREWSTRALGADQVGWDWFSLQLGDGRELMYYQLRRSDGSVDPHSSGTLVAPDGTSRSLGSEDVELTVLSHWESPRSGARYPSRWSLRVPAEGLALTVTPYLPDQEMDLSVLYWEGAVQVEGTADGSGYVELTGYD